MRAIIASGLVCALGLTTALAPALDAASPGVVAPILVEVHPNPLGPDTGGEWFELFNPAVAPLPLDGWAVTDHDACPGGSAFPLDGLTVPAGGRLVVALPSGTSCLNLVNTADDLALVAPGGVEVQAVSWGPGGDVASPGDGVSVATCMAAPVLHAAWTLAPQTRGTDNPSC